MTADAPKPDDWADEAADLAALFARTAPTPPPFDAAALRTQVAPARSRFRLHRSLVMKLSALTLAAAAVVAVVVWFNPTPAEAKVLTFQEVKEAVERSEMMTATMFHSGPGGELFASARISLAKKPMRLLHEGISGHLIQVWDYQSNRELIVFPTEGRISLRPLGEEALGFWLMQDYSVLDGRLHAKPVDVELDGRRVWRFDVSWRNRSVPADEPHAVVPLRIWVDPETKLPVRRESGEGDDLLVIKDFQWAESFDPRLFPTLPPAVEKDLRQTVNAVPDQYASKSLKAITARNGPYVPFVFNGLEPGDAALGAAFGPTLTPGEGLGPLRLGQSFQQVEEATGVPPFWVGPEDFWFYLPSRGVTARGTASDGVVQIYVGTGPLPGFAGTIAGGVTRGMNGTEIERRLGPPDRVVEHINGRDTIWHYDSRRLSIVSWHDAAVSASIRSPAAEPLP